VYKKAVQHIILVAGTYVRIYQYYNNMVNKNTCVSGAKLLTILDPKDMHVSKHPEKYYVLLSTFLREVN
jgi:hypothetical protein